jgi:hypothetical protein|tara:strand:+ start:428 stop:772 length:345 start_codon:yes stop_codon:yes gene_type:complete
MAQTKGNGAGVAEFVTGSLISRHNLAAILVDTGADLRTEDDATGEAVEKALQMIQPLMYEVTDDNSGKIHCIVDGSQLDAASLQIQLRAIGTSAVNSYNFATATVTLGTGMVVS